MPAWVKVVRNDGGGVGDSVYVNANYFDIAGFVGTAFETETGKDTFETLDANGFPIWRKEKVITQAADNTKDNPVPVTLEPVAPGT
jgi:hypothetical protein